MENRISLIQTTETTIFSPKIKAYVKVAILNRKRGLTTLKQEFLFPIQKRVDVFHAVFKIQRLKKGKKYESICSIMAQGLFLSHKPW